jgi:hypothetical protein
MIFGFLIFRMLVNLHNQIKKMLNTNSLKEDDILSLLFSFFEDDEENENIYKPKL